jgi:hypothetical protein
MVEHVAQVRISDRARSLQRDTLLHRLLFSLASER